MLILAGAYMAAANGKLTLSLVAGCYMLVVGGIVLFRVWYHYLWVLNVVELGLVH